MRSVPLPATLRHSLRSPGRYHQSLCSLCLSGNVQRERLVRRVLGKLGHKDGAQRHVVLFKQSPRRVGEMARCSWEVRLRRTTPSLVQRQVEVGNEGSISANTRTPHTNARRSTGAPSTYHRAQHGSQEELRLYIHGMIVSWVTRHSEDGTTLVIFPRRRPLQLSTRQRWRRKRSPCRSQHDVRGFAIYTVPQLAMVIVALGLPVPEPRASIDLTTS